MNWISIVLLIGVVQGLFLVFLLLSTPKGNRAANPWLAASVAAFALNTVGDVMQESDLVLRYPHTALVFDWLLLLVGPLTLFYVRALTGEIIRMRSFLPHALPAFALFWWIIPYHLLPETQMREALMEDRASAGKLNVLVLLMVLQTLGYWFWSVRVLRRHSQRLKQQYSDIAQRSFAWLATLLKLNLALWLLWVLALTTNTAFAQALSNLAFPIVAYVAGYCALRQPQVFFEPVSEASASVAADATSSKYAKSSLTPERAKEIITALERVMTDSKPHLQNDLTLTELARQVDASAHHLSQIFSESIGTSFFDYINTRRIEDVKRRLTDPRESSATILDIAYSAGFNSKAAFNAAFRKYVGTTPSAFRRTARSTGH